MRRGHAGSPGGIPRDLDAPTVVIVHGAWVDATDWREVIALLQVKGLSVIAVQNPLSSLADDVDTVTRAINHQSSPIVLVGQGYGGTVITQAGNHPRRCRPCLRGSVRARYRRIDERYAEGLSTAAMRRWT